uniref:Uncharacterized protein n=1 Tax=Oryza punctata TaxID=4537 RepID=A0A0E0KUP3_ORYPU
MAGGEAAVKIYPQDDGAKRGGNPRSPLEQASSGFSPNLGDAGAGGAVRATAAALTTAADLTVYHRDEGDGHSGSYEVRCN